MVRGSDAKTAIPRIVSFWALLDTTRVLLPSGPEFIRREDGERKNDCELNAAKRYLPRFRREHPKLPVLVLDDALMANAPMVQLLREQRMNFLLVAEEGNCRHLFQHLRAEAGA